jgi:hypothetical protein
MRRILLTSTPAPAGPESLALWQRANSAKDCRNNFKHAIDGRLPSQVKSLSR